MTALYPGLRNMPLPQGHK